MSEKTIHVTRTIRIPSKLDSGLRELAKGRKTSVNALVEGAISKLIDYDQYAEERGYVGIPRSLLVKLLDYLSEDEIKELATWAGKGPGSETIRFYHKEISVEAVLDSFQTIGSKYNKFFGFHHESEGAKHTITITHNMGMKWSIYFEAIMRNIFNEQLRIEIQTERTQNLTIGYFADKSSNSKMG